MARYISAIHVAKAKLGMDDETYRAFLLNTVGKKSCAKMTEKELQRVLNAMRKAGFQPKDGANAADPQARKIRALWISMGKAGIVRNSAEAALEAYVRRITGCSLAEATVKQCQAVIETLKKWIDRVEDQNLHAQLMDILRSDAAEVTVIGGHIVAGARHVVQ